MPQPLLQNGHALTLPELQEAARDALRTAGVTQADAARKLEVTPATVSKALNSSDASRYVQALRGIVEAFSPFVVEDAPRYLVRRKEDGA